MGYPKFKATILTTLVIASLAGSLTGCKDLTGSQQLPSGTTDPKFYNTKQGALLERNSAIVSFSGALSRYIIDAGFITDELEDVNTDAGQGTILANGNSVSNPLDERFLSSSTGSSDLDGSQSYGLLQGTRGFTAQAIGMLATYDTAIADLKSQKIMRAELYSLTGYTEIMLADLFCSGVPLSTLDFQRDFTYHAGSTTSEVYLAAVAQFDTALILADTSTQIGNLARVGKGRAYLNLGQYDSASAAVQPVPDGFVYNLSSNNILGWSGNCPDIGNLHGFVDGLNCRANMSDIEGGRGLPFRSSGDPRSLGLSMFENRNSGDSIYFPVKYQSFLTSASTSALPSLAVTVASGVEARLIQAEGAFHNGGDWFGILQTLHSTLSGVTGLTDPGPSSPNPDSARVSLIFRERAEWLYLTGSRQGDLRRLLRQYSQYFHNPNLVYPSGVYTAPGLGRYGTDINAQIPQSESVNPLFHGCLSRGP